jgi:hypothetical protein
MSTSTERMRRLRERRAAALIPVDGQAPEAERGDPLAPSWPAEYESAAAAVRAASRRVEALEQLRAAQLERDGQRAAAVKSAQKDLAGMATVLSASRDQVAAAAAEHLRSLAALASAAAEHNARHSGVAPRPGTAPPRSCLTGCRPTAAACRRGCGASGPLDVPLSRWDLHPRSEAALGLPPAVGTLTSGRQGAPQAPAGPFQYGARPGHSDFPASPPPGPHGSSHSAQRLSAHPQAGRRWAPHRRWESQGPAVLGPCTDRHREAMAGQGPDGTR